MKAVILAGGRGTRLGGENGLVPKPMVEIGGRPILWHIMKIYERQGITDFVICLGYMGYVIKEYFANYLLHTNDVSIDLGSNQIEYHNGSAASWRITLAETGVDTETGGRLRRVRRYLDRDEPFCMTYGDGLGDVDISAAIQFHRCHGLQATVTVVLPPGRFGATILDGHRVSEFSEKPAKEGGYINGGFFVLSPATLDLIDDDTTIWERKPLETLAARNQLAAFRHDGFWQPLDTVRDRQQLEALWNSGIPPWKSWSD